MTLNSACGQTADSSGERIGQAGAAINGQSVKCSEGMWVGTGKGEAEQDTWELGARQATPGLL